MNNKELRKKLLNIFSDKQIEEIAKYSKLKKRNSGKLKPDILLWLGCFSNKNICLSSLEEMVSYLNFEKNISISPQALDQRLGEEAVSFFKNIFISLFKNQFSNKSKAANSYGFKNIFLMDSTEIKLPNKSKNKYRGNQLQSTLKINLLLELLNFSIKNISLDEGIKSEMNFSKYVYKHLSIDSLVLKDLGYFKFEDFKEIEDKNSFFISRLRAGTRLFSLNPAPVYSKNGNIIEKTKYLVTNAGKLGNDLDINETKEYEFLVGDQKMPIRIVLTKLSEELLDKRTQKIEKRERRGNKLSTLARESVNISGYITNLWGFSPFEIIEIYKMRWQIELLFKIFKSDFKIDKLKNLKTERIEAHIYATLIRILLLLEITKSLDEGYTRETSVRRSIKSTLVILSDFLVRLKDEKKFLSLCSRLKNIKKKIKKRFLANKNHQEHKAVIIYIVLTLFTSGFLFFKKISIETKKNLNN